jgi:hypothetical protein
MMGLWSLSRTGVSWWRTATGCWARSTRPRTWCRRRRLTANGQPALAAYAPEPGGGHRLHTLQVFTVMGDRVAHNVVFADPRVFEAFDLPSQIS